MDSPLLNMPDDPAQIASWLEELLFSPLLDRLVAEIRALNPPPQPQPLPSGHRSASRRTRSGQSAYPVPLRFLNDGLVALPPEDVSRLLRRPDLLLQVRDLVLTEGGTYWDRHINTAEATGAAERAGKRVLHLLSSGEKNPDETAATVYLTLADVVGARDVIDLESSVWLQHLDRTTNRAADVLSGPHRDWLMSRLEAWSSRVRQELGADDAITDSYFQAVQVELRERANLLRGPTPTPPAG